MLHRMEAFVTAGTGFLLAVLWFDLMHDVLVRGHDPSEVLPEPALAGIAGYYARVTTDAHPMGRLVAVAMLGTVAAIVVELATGYDPVWVPAVSVPLALAPMGLAGRRTFPNAARLGQRIDDPTEQSRLARAIYRDHRLCLVCMAVLLIIQLGASAR